MPTERTRSKDDTWTTDELNKALKGERRKHRGSEEDKSRRRDDDGRSERRRHKDDLNGDSSHGKKRSEEGDSRRRRRQEEEDGDSGTKLTEDEREKLRRERREKREKDSGTSSRKKEEKKSRDEKDGEAPDRERRHRDDDGRRHRSERDDDERRKHRDGEEDRRRNDERPKQRDDEDRRRRRDDDDRRKHKDDEDRRRHRDDEGGRRRRDEDEDGRRRHRDDEDRRKRRDDEDQRKRRDDEDQRKHRDRDERKKHRDDDDRRRDKEEDDKRRHRDEGDRKKTRDEDEKKRHRDDDEKRRKRRDEDDEDKERRRRREEREKGKTKTDEDDREKRQRDRHKAEDQEEDILRHPKVLTRQHRVESPEDLVVDLDEEERERRRRERREKREGKDDKEKKHRDDRDKEERKRTDDRDKEERKRTDDRDREERKHRDEKMSREKLDQAERKGVPDHQEEADREEEEAGEADYEEDFEDYEDDFEDYEPQAEAKRKDGVSMSHMDTEHPSRLGYFVNIDEGEVEEVLRALDEENNRLLNASRRSNWSDSTDLSDERFQSPRKTRDPERDEEPVRKPRPVGGIFNFVSAKQRVMSRKLMGKTQQRATALAKIIELDVAKYDMFDLAPVREYELYIRNFGSANTKQAYVQTNEDNIEREIQTDEIDSNEKWTQHPAEDMKDCGGDGINADSEAQSTVSVSGESGRLSQFLGKTGQIIGILLEEEKRNYDGDTVAGQKANLSWSNGFLQLGSLSILSGRMVKEACFCPGQPNMLLTIHSAPTQSAEVVTQGPNASKRGLLCVWNIYEPSIPHRMLACEAYPSCCCFSPSKASLAFAGMRDGSVVCWDLREPNFMHQKVNLEGEEFVVRYPTYNTARVLEEENHLSPVMSILPVYSVTASSKAGAGDASDTSGLSFQLATLEEEGVINLWVVAEIPAPDTAGSQVDLGLAPGGRIKLVKSSKICLDSPVKDIRLRSSLHMFDLQLKPDDLNHYYVGTDMGHIIHGVRFGSRPFPRSHMPSNEAPVQIRSIDFSPFGCPYFLAGCDDGSVLLFHTQLEKPIISWPSTRPGQSVLCVRWSSSRPAVFFVLDSSSTVIVFDLIEAEMVAVKNDHIKAGRVVSMALSPDLRKAEFGANPHPPQLFLAMENGTTEVHTINKQFTEPQTLELEFLQNYVDRF